MSGIGKAMAKLFGGGKPPEPATPPPPIDRESPAAKAAMRKKVTARRGEGRDGTIYGSYGNSNLAGTA